MPQLQRYLKQELRTLERLQHTNRKCIDEALAYIHNSSKLVQSVNPFHHFCTFTVPYDERRNSIYLVNHRKANDWIPPGGHIEAGELPLQTVKREIAEELGYQITNERIRLIDLSIKHITNAKNPCKIHYDLWYVVYIPETSFTYDNREFTDAGWYSFDQVFRLTKTPEFLEVIQKMPDLL